MGKRRYSSTFLDLGTSSGQLDAPAAFPLGNKYVPDGWLWSSDKFPTDVTNCHMYVSFGRDWRFRHLAFVRFDAILSSSLLCNFYLAFCHFLFYMSNILLVTLFSNTFIPCSLLFRCVTPYITLEALHWIQDVSASRNTWIQVWLKYKGSEPRCYWGWETLLWVWSVFTSKHLSMLAYVWFLDARFRIELRNDLQAPGSISGEASSEAICIKWTTSNTCSSSSVLVMFMMGDYLLGNPKFLASVHNYP
jgi:hypothetical protein